MNAITTKYISPTNMKGSRIKATAGNGQTITIGYPHQWNEEGAHAQAALALCHKMQWDGPAYRRNFAGLIGGGTKDGYAFVFSGTEGSSSFYRFWYEDTAETPALQNNINAPKGMKLGVDGQLVS